MTSPALAPEGQLLAPLLLGFWNTHFQPVLVMISFWLWTSGNRWFLPLRLSAWLHLDPWTVCPVLDLYLPPPVTSVLEWQKMERRHVPHLQCSAWGGTEGIGGGRGRQGTGHLWVATVILKLRAVRVTQHMSDRRAAQTTAKKPNGGRVCSVGLFFRFTAWWFDICIHCKMITTPNLGH